MASLVAQTVKASAYNVGDPDSIPGWGRSLEKEMAPTPVLLSGKPHGLRSLVGCSPWGHKESDITERLHFTSLHNLMAKVGRRKWQPTPVFLIEESHGRQSLVGCRLWGPTESDTTEVT